MQEPKAKRIDGQKKFTATLAGFAMSFLNALATTGVMTGEPSSLLTQIIAIVGPILGAGGYDVVQGSHDKKKEEIRKVEIEQRFLLPEKPAAPLPLPRRPKKIDFEAFIGKVKARTEIDKSGNVKATSLYHALRDEGDEWDVEYFPDLYEYARLVTDAAERTFEERNGFALNDPDLAAKLRTMGKCPYATVEAYCAYEGDRVSLREVYEAREKERDVYGLGAEDTTGKWRNRLDVSLFGLWNKAYLIRQDIASGGR